MDVTEYYFVRAKGSMARVVANMYQERSRQLAGRRGHGGERERSKQRRRERTDQPARPARPTRPSRGGRSARGRRDGLSPAPSALTVGAALCSPRTLPAQDTARHPPRPSPGWKIGRSEGNKILAGLLLCWSCIHSTLLYLRNVSTRVSDPFRYLFHPKILPPSFRSELKIFL